MIRDLKPCPFCGSNAVFVQNTLTDKVAIGVHFDEPVALVVCASCAAAVGFFKIKNDVTVEEAETKAIEYWNVRALPEDWAYKIVCDGCINEKHCHETLDYCDKYLELIGVM